MSDPTPTIVEKAAAGAPRAHRGTPYSFELERVLPLDEAAVLTGLSQDSLRRHYKHLILHLSPRRVGIRLRDVLTIGTGSAAA
jgi:hypothetical protein